MCLGIPGRVVERPADVDELPWAVVEFAGVRRRVCVACVPECRTGDYVVVHAGIAISRLEPDEAERALEYLDIIGEADDWDDGPLGDPREASG